MDDILFIDGGLGRCVSATGAINNSKYKSLVTSYPSIFIGKNIKELYGTNTEYLVEKILHDKNLLVIEPYILHDFYNKKKHISQMFNLLINNKDEFIKPTLTINDESMKRIKQWLLNNKVQKYVFFQPFGGEYNNDLSWRSMDYNFAQNIINIFNENNITVLYQKGYGHPKLNNCIELDYLQIGIPEMICFIKNANYIVSIDSATQHIATAVDKKALVFWTGTDVLNFGYDNNINIKVGEPMKYIFRIPLNNPNRLHSNPYVWDKKYLKNVKEYIEEY